MHNAHIAKIVSKQLDIWLLLHPKIFPDLNSIKYFKFKIEKFIHKKYFEFMTMGNNKITHKNF